MFRASEGLKGIRLSIAFLVTVLLLQTDTRVPEYDVWRIVVLS